MRLKSIYSMFLLGRSAKPRHLEVGFLIAPFLCSVPSLYPYSILTPSTLSHAVSGKNSEGNLDFFSLELSLYAHAAD